jgi:hypothetical protein
MLRMPLLGLFFLFSTNIWALDFEHGDEARDALNIESLPSLLQMRDSETGEREYGMPSLQVEVLGESKEASSKGVQKIELKDLVETESVLADPFSLPRLFWPGDPSLGKFRIGLVRDSNVFQYGDRSRLPSNIDDVRYELDLSIGKSIGDQHRFSYHLTSRTYADNDQLDLMGHELRYVYSMKKGKSHWLLPVGVQQFHQDGSSLYRGWDLSPVVFHQHRIGRELWLWMTALTVTHRSFDSAIFKAFDGEQYSLQMKEIWLGRSGREIAFKASLDANSLSDANQASREALVGIEPSGTLFLENWTYRANLDWKWRNNRGVLLTDADKRKDHGLGIGFEVVAPLADWKMTMGYRYRDYNSNLNRYTYTQGQFYAHWTWRGEG